MSCISTKGRLSNYLEERFIHSNSRQEITHVPFNWWKDKQIVSLKKNELLIHTIHTIHINTFLSGPEKPSVF